LLRERDCALPLRIEFRVHLDCTEQSNWEIEIERLRQLLGQPEPKPERILCPYPGMVPFQEKDARFFYGREDKIRQMLQHFRNQRLLFVIGPSGCGKSSLVFAGLLPQLQSSTYFDEGFWLLKQMRPGALPLQELGTVLGSDPNSELVGKLLAANPPAQRLLLAVDQFEELFSQAERAEQSGVHYGPKGTACSGELCVTDHDACRLLPGADEQRPVGRGIEPPDGDSASAWGCSARGD
jgi:hypothetical protein